MRNAPYDAAIRSQVNKTKTIGTINNLKSNHYASRINDPYCRLTYK
jgi:hypothetical protein